MIDPYLTNLFHYVPIVTKQVLDQHIRYLIQYIIYSKLQLRSTLTLKIKSQANII